MQWKAPEDLSAWVQRAGRAARAPGRKGLAVLLVERSAFAPQDPSSKGKDPANPATKKKAGQHAVAHGVKRGHYAARNDEITRLDEPDDIPKDAPKEGLFAYIQTMQCRRKVIARVFGNEPSSGKFNYDYHP